MQIFQKQFSFFLRTKRVSILILLAIFPFTAYLQDNSTVKLAIGMNLSGIADWQNGYPFKNLMWGARPWLTKNIDGSGPFDTGMAEKIPLDSDGYPLEIPYKPEGVEQPQIVFTIIPNRTEPGRYVVLYDGEGEISGAMGTELIESSSGRAVIKLVCDKKVRYEGISIIRSKKGNHIRNIRILKESDENAALNENPFREDFLDYCKQWRALRFMDWAVTNNSFEKEWSKRKKPSFYTMVGSGGDAIGRWGPLPSEFKLRFSGGVAIEIMIQLANTVKVSPWFCMPHRATEEYMTEFAKMVKNKLDPSLKVYVEYSNELWNWSFQQSQWMLNCKIAADPLVGTQSPGWKNGVIPQDFPFDDGQVAKDAGADHPERIAVLNRRCFKCWESVFDGDDRQRLIRVVGVQHAWPDTARRTAKWVVQNGGADAISPAGYIGPDNEIYQRWERAGSSLSAEQVIADMNEAFEKNSKQWTLEIAKIAKKYNLRYIVYEGGQHIQPKNQAETNYMPALKDAQYHKGMYDLYMKNFALHQQIGCELFMAFASVSEQGTRWGSWGHQEYYGQNPNEIPKLKALLDANRISSEK